MVGENHCHLQYQWCGRNLRSLSKLLLFHDAEDARVNDEEEKAITYQIFPSTIRPIPHSTDLPVPKLPESWSSDEDSREHCDDEFNVSDTHSPHPITQEELDDLVLPCTTIIKVKQICLNLGSKAGRCWTVT